MPATPSSTKTPGIYFRVDLTAGAQNLGLGAQRALLIAWKDSDGDLTEDTEVRTCFGSDDVAVALGVRAPGKVAADAFFRAFGDAKLDVVAAVAPSGAAAEATWTITGTPTDLNQFDFDVSGRKTGPVSWAVGETVATYRTRVIGALNAIKDVCGLAVTGGAAGEVDFVASTQGAWGNDITVGVKKLSGAGGAVAVGAAKCAGGAGEINVTNVLLLVDATEYDFIGLVTSNADAEDNSSSSNAERLLNHINANLGGGNTLFQYGYVGHTGTQSNAKAGAIGRNGKPMSMVYAQAAQSLPCEYMGADMGDAMRWSGIRANYNRIGNRAPGLFGAKDQNGDKLRQAEKEDLLNNGVAPYDFVPLSDEMALVAPITTYSLDGAGNPDYRCFWQSDVLGVFAIGRDLRSALPAEFPNCSITEDLPPSVNKLPPNVVERRDVEAFVFTRLRAWATSGVVDSNELEASIVAGTVSVRIDASNKSKVNIAIPKKIVKPLAIFDVSMAKTG